MKPFKKWNLALKRYTEAEAELKGGCDSKKFTKCHYDEWIAFLDTVRGKDKLAQLKAVNKHMNKSKYIIDQTNWGEKSTTGRRRLSSWPSSAIARTTRSPSSCP